MNAIADDVIRALKAKLQGPVILPEDPRYDQARSIWNAMIDKHPGAIAQCTGAADVRYAVQVAIRHRLLLSVRSGGHNIAGNALCDGGLTLDLSGMKSVRIDPETRRAQVKAGATLGDLDRAAQPFGLATPVGINSTTGVAGL